MRAAILTQWNPRIVHRARVQVGKPIGLAQTPTADLWKANVHVSPLQANVHPPAAVTAAAKIELGVVVPNPEPSPRPVPSFAPLLTVVSVDGRLVKIRLADPAHPTHKRMPAGVDGATVMSFVGAEAPSDPFDYKYEGSTSKTTVDILFPESVAPGTQVWLTAFFFNERKQNGPACAGVGAIINYGGTMPMAA
jgi:hypothetical protein